jgi:hypothetical protein
MLDDAPVTPEPTPISDNGPIPDAAIAAAAEMAADPAPAAPDPTPVPALSEMDAIGLEIIGLKQRADLLEKRLAYLDNLFAWPPGLK